MINQCADLIQNDLLEQLREEGCKLIQWSDDLKNQIPQYPNRYNTDYTGLKYTVGPPNSDPEKPWIGDGAHNIPYMSNHKNRALILPSKKSLLNRKNKLLGGSPFNNQISDYSPQKGVENGYFVNSKGDIIGPERIDHILDSTKNGNLEDQEGLLTPGSKTPINYSKNVQFSLNNANTNLNISSLLKNVGPELMSDWMNPLDGQLSNGTQNPTERLLLILYNNYKFVLKKYEELNEQKLSYIEGIKEYQYKLDNSNYLIQLQRSQLNNLTTIAAANSGNGKDGDNVLATGWLKKEQDLLKREKELLDIREGELAAKEQLIKEREEGFTSREEELTSKQKELAEREASLVSKENEFSQREKVLLDKEEVIRTKEKELETREEQLGAREQELANRELLKPGNSRGKMSTRGSRDKSILVEEHGEVLYKASPALSNKDPKSDDEIDNEAITSTYIQNMNANNEDMYVLKKNMLNKIVLKKCNVRIESNFLEFQIKSTWFKLALKDITRVHFGQDSHSYQIHTKRSGSGESDSWPYFTIYTVSEKNINMYCDNEYNVKVWRNGLNRILLNQTPKGLTGGDMVPSNKGANSPPTTKLVISPA